MGFSLKKAIKSVANVTGLGGVFDGVSSIFGGTNGANFFDPLDITGTTARKYQDEQAKADRAFQSKEALTDRQWQEQMSNTAHQREMADLKAAGLNPILAANSGAPVTGGASASGAMAGSASGNPEALMGLLNAFASIKNAKSNAKMADTTLKDVESQVNARATHTANEVAETAARIENIKQDTANKLLEGEAQSMDNSINRQLGTSKGTPQSVRTAKEYTINLVRSPGALLSAIKTSIQHNKSNKEAKIALDKIDYNQLSEKQKEIYRQIWLRLHVFKGKNGGK